MFLVLLLLPLGLFAACAGIASRRWPTDALRAAAAGTAACVVTALVAALIIGSNRRWSGSNELAWTGVAAQRAGAPLRIAGPKQEATVGWPTGTFSPELEIRGDTSAHFRIRLTHQNAFLFVGEHALNGQAIPDGGEVVSGGFRVSWRRYHVLQGMLEIKDSTGRPLALSRFPAGNRTIPLGTLVAPALFSLRQQHHGEVAARLEAWAATHWLLSRPRQPLIAALRHAIDDDHIPRLVSEADTDTVVVDRHDAISVLWPGRSQPFELTEDDGRVTVTWSAPWVRNSPAPPESRSRAVSLVICGSPLPGDTAFTIPFGGPLLATREHLVVANGRFVAPVDSFALPDLTDGTPLVHDVKSDTVIVAGPYRVRVTSLSDLPDATHFALVLAVGVVMMIAALTLDVRPLREGQPWLVTGVALAYWTLLVLRFVLAVRFALDPGHIDRLAVSGVERAALALVIMPGILLLATVGLRREAGEAQAAAVARAQRTLWHALGLFVSGVCVVLYTRHLWPNLPTRLSVPWSGLGLAVSLAGLIAVALSTRYDVLPASLRVFERLVPAAGRGVWASTFVNREPGTKGRSAVRRRRETFRFTWLVLAGSLLVVMALLALVQYALQQLRLSSGTELQEVVTPLLFFWAPAGLLLAAPARGADNEPAHTAARERLSLVRSTLVIGVIVSAVLLLPVAVHSAGELLAAIAVLASATIVLIATSRAGAVSLLCLGFLGAMGVAVVIIFLNINPLTPTLGAWGEMRPRVLAWLEGRSLVSRLPLLPLNDSSSVIGEQRVGNAIEHVWENEALAQEGGWWGLGWGNAPTDRSLIRHDTVQFDSEFSFYIASEFGFWGGLALLLAYLAPLGLVLSTPPRTTLGAAFAAAIASALFFEAASHALMNIGALPFTGRDLPLLAVNSNADLWRWTLLLFLLLQAATYWRPASGAAPEPEGGLARRAAIIGLVPLLAIGWFAWRGREVAERRAAPVEFDWTPMLREVRRLVLQQRIRYDPKHHQIVFRAPPGYTGATLIEQEAARFNALSDSEKADRLLAHHAPEYAERVSRVKSLDDWDAVMDSLRGHDERNRPALRPSIFRLVRRPADGPSADAQDEAADESTPHTTDTTASDTAETGGLELTVPALDDPLDVDSNPEFNARVTFHVDGAPDRMPRVVWAGTTPSPWTIGAEAFALPLFVDSAALDTAVTNDADGALWDLVDSSRAGTHRSALWLRVADPETRRPVSVYVGAFTASSQRVQFVPGDITGRKLGGWWPWSGAFEHGRPVDLGAGDVIRIASPGTPGRRYDLALRRTPPPALIGPAWVRGEWIDAYETDHRIPWIAYLAHVVPREYDRLGDSAAAQYGSLTLEPSLQGAAQVFVDTMGRHLHARLLRTAANHGRLPQYRLPPRVALSVIRLPGGEALALGGWPRMSSEPFWFRDDAMHEWVPPVSWIDERAPASIRARYGTDRNFEPLSMGSTTKPLWASVVLALHRGLEHELVVRGASGMEDSAFGIPLGTRGWEVPNSVGLNGAPWADLTSFLARSDNRFQVRLGLLGLAESDDQGSAVAVEEAPSPSRLESMDGGTEVWHHYPRFPTGIGFGYRRPTAMTGLADVPLARRWRRVFGVETSWLAHPLYRRSFWTGDEADDQRPHRAPPNAAPALPGQLDAISPERADLALDRITDARQYVTLLLGGGANAWANVDFAAAFGSAVTGQVVLAHITPEPVRPMPDRLAAPREAALIRPGVSAVLANPAGTAYDAFREALPILHRFGDVYAKTGTLTAKRGIEPMSRIVVAVVRWSPDRKRVEDGLVFSLAVERGGLGTAQRWLADFVVQNEPILRRILRAKAQPSPAPVAHKVTPEPTKAPAPAAREMSIRSHIDVQLEYARRDAGQGWYVLADYRLRDARAWVDSLTAIHANDNAADSLTKLVDAERADVRQRCQSLTHRPGVAAPHCP